MKYIFLLSGDYIDLAKEEILSLFDIKKFRLVDKLLIVDLKTIDENISQKSKRLALTKSIFRLLFECKLNDLIEIMKKFNWNSIYKDSFCLRMHYLEKFNSNNKNKTIKNYTKIKQKSQATSDSVENFQFSSMIENPKGIYRHKHNGSKPLVIISEKYLAKYIWHSVNKPKVDLENPRTKIELFVIDDAAYCGLLLYENNENFESRKSHLRPFPHPSSLHPKLARALVNISGITENEILLDPFCGTGGFQIEAGLMHIKIIGCDISKNMVKGCKENLKHFKIKKCKIVNKNALKINKKVDYVVTDLPYGLNSNVYLQQNKKSLKYNSNKINLKLSQKDAIKNLEQFYLQFLKKVRNILKRKAVIIFPNYANYKKLLKTAKLKIEKEFSIYVHRNLTRKIVLLRNQ